LASTSTTPSFALLAAFTAGAGATAFVDAGAIVVVALVDEVAGGCAPAATVGFDEPHAASATNALTPTTTNPLRFVACFIASSLASAPR